MKITKRQLRKIIQERAQYFQAARGQYKVDMTALQRAQPIITNWVDLLLDEFKDEIPQAENIPDEKRGMMIKTIADEVWKTLPNLFGAYVPMEPGMKRLGESKMRITRRQLRKIIREQLMTGSQDTLSLLKRLVTDNPFMQLRNDLADTFDEENVDFVTEPLPMYTVIDRSGKQWGILNAKYAEEPDAIIGNIAIGVME